MFSKKAQVGETITWVVATIIIVVILIISVVVSTAYLGKGKTLEFFNSKDSLASKSLFSYLLTSDGEEKVYEQLIREENLNEFNGNLGEDIFKEFYREAYPAHVWLGINFEGFGLRKNDYFGERPTSQRGGDINRRTVSYVSEIIQLSEDKELELRLMNE